MNGSTFSSMGPRAVVGRVCRPEMISCTRLNCSGATMGVWTAGAPSESRPAYVGFRRSRRTSRPVQAPRFPDFIAKPRSFALVTSSTVVAPLAASAKNQRTTFASASTMTSCLVRGSDA